MSTSSERVAKQLPYLRRFARAVTGSQSGGDAYVAEALEAIIQEPSLIADEARTRLALYKTLLKAFNSISVNCRDDVRAQGIADGRLQALAPKPRQAFLLVAVEELTPDEAAECLGVGSAELTSLIDQAAKDIANQIATEILIIEDEPLIALDLKEIVTNLGHRVPRIARTRAQALEAIKTLKPGLVLADIQLADGSSGLDTVNDILTTRNLPVVFVTAYPERLLTGVRPEPTFLITKPFQPDVVKAIVSQALFFDVKGRTPQ